jgi:hypothetical protein
LLSFLFAKDYNSTAALFPRLVALSALLFLALDLISKKVGARKPREVGQPPDSTLQPPPWLPALALQGGYIIFVYLIGFSAATLLFLLAVPAQMRYRRWPITALYAILLTVAIYVSFHWLFHVRLPKGLIGLPW